MKEKLIYIVGVPTIILMIALILKQVENIDFKEALTWAIIGAVLTTVLGYVVIPFITDLLCKIFRW